MLHPQVDAVLVDTEVPFHIDEVGFQQGLGVADTGVADQDVNSATSALSLLDEVPPITFARHVVMEPERVRKFEVGSRASFHRISAITTYAPSLLKRTASPQPCPPAAPVINATLPAK